jgi:hypothetical protein
MRVMSPTVRPEPAEGISFLPGEMEGRDFEKLSPNGFPAPGGVL